nr:EOG090X08S2 [Triops cancriformis]
MDVFSVAELFDLRTNKDLLDPAFEGYKLSLEPLPIYQKELSHHVTHLLPSDDQFSYQHIKVFGLHNHLHADPFSSNVAYFIDTKSAIQRCEIASVEERMTLTQVWQLPEPCSSCEGRYNSSLSFPGPDFALVSDGWGTLYVCKRNNESWSLGHAVSPLGNARPFAVMHSTLQNTGSSSHIHVLLLHIENTANVGVSGREKTPTSITPLLASYGLQEKDHPFSSILDWITLGQCSTGGWMLERHQRLLCPHGVDYTCILPTGQHLNIAAREPLIWLYDSANPSQWTQKQLNVIRKVDVPNYAWSQSPQDLRLCFNIGPVGVGDVKLVGMIKVEESTWSLVDGTLEVWLHKGNELEIWPTFCSPLFLVDFLIDESVGKRAPVFSNAQLEEVDTTPDEELVLWRLDRNRNETTLKCPLGGHQLLFSQIAPDGRCPWLCLRHDVDGLMWEPVEEANFHCQHVATLQALGYVQVSKEQRKFTLCPTDFSYVAIIDSIRHVYLYRQPTLLDMELRHRPSGRSVSHVARQQVLSLPSGDDEILGAFASSVGILLLTHTKLCLVALS